MSKKSIAEKSLFASKITRIILDWWPESLYGVTTLIWGFISVFPDSRVPLIKADYSLPEFLFWVAFVLTLVGAIGIYKKKKSLDEAEQELQAAQELSSRYEKDVRVLLEHILSQLALECGLGGDNGQCKDDVRLSVYCHDPVKSCFIRIARISGNPSFANSGRLTYPDHLGVISEGWKHSFHRFKSVASNDEEWIEEQLRDSNMDRAVAEKINMKSRVILAFRLYENMEAVGVMVVESTTKSRFDGSLKTTLEKGQWFTQITHFVAELQESHVKRVAVKSHDGDS